MAALAAVRQWTVRGYDFLRYLIVHFDEDHCAGAAASLAYTSLLALVPLFTVIVVFFSAFPAFQSLRQDLEVFTFENFVPAFGGTVRDYLLEFAGKAQELTAAGIVVLVVTVLAMLATIESEFNVIWRVERRRAHWVRFLVYWAVVTLGPFLIGVGLVASSYVASLPLLAGAASSVGAQTGLLVVLPTVTSTLAFWILFKWLPNRPVPGAHALIGALVASILFEIAKHGFAWYVINVPGQTAIYGTFATLPVFLLWIYLSWVIVLFGAEITKCLTTWPILTARQRRGGQHDEFYAAYRVLARLYDAQSEGRTLSEADLVLAEPALGFSAVALALQKLDAARWISRSESYRWLLARDLNRLTLVDLLQTVPSTISDLGLAVPRADDRDERLHAQLAELGRWLSGNLAIPLTSVMSGK